MRYKKVRLTHPITLPSVRRMASTASRWSDMRIKPLSLAAVSPEYIPSPTHAVKLRQELAVLDRAKLFKHDSELGPSGQLFIVVPVLVLPLYAIRRLTRIDSEADQPHIDSSAELRLHQIPFLPCFSSTTAAKTRAGAEAPHTCRYARLPDDDTARCRRELAERDGSERDWRD